MSSEELSETISRPEVYVTLGGKVARHEDSLIHTILDQVCGTSEKAVSLAKQDLQIAETFRKDPNIKKFVIVSNPVITSTASITQQKGIIRKVNYSLQVSTNAQPNRDIQVEKF
ncbi:MAG: hypothetical protein ABI361_06930 [Nitrososphaera sp.]